MPVPKNAPKEEVRFVKFIFDLYAGDGQLDAVDVIDAVYGLRLNPTRQLVKSITGENKRGDKFYNIDGFWDIYMALKDNKDEGGFLDFVECLRTFDVGENGKMKMADLTCMLTTLGEVITDDEMWTVMDDCAVEGEDDDGWFPYYPFLCRLCDQPVPKGSIIPP